MLFSLARNNFVLIIALVCLTLFSIQEGAEAYIILFAIPALLYQIVQLSRNWRTPEQRITRIGAIALVIFSVILVVGIHVQRSDIARVKAEWIVKSIEIFKTEHGRYPAELSEVGIANDEIKSLRAHYFVDSEKRPFFLYESTTTAFSKLKYNFETREWEEHGD
jgi:hypothetical protein